MKLKEAVSKKVGGKIVKATKRWGTKEHFLFNDNGELNKYLPKTIKEALSEPAKEVVEINKEEIARRERKRNESKENRKTSTEAQKENIDRNINEEQEEIDLKEKTKKWKGECL